MLRRKCVGWRLPRKQPFLPPTAPRFPQAAVLAIRQLAVYALAFLCRLWRLRVGSREMSTFDDLRAQCLSTGRLFEDKVFPANGQSIYPGENNPEDWLWKRAKDICKDPKLTIDGATRFDLMQGDLGDCWFIAAAAVLATKKELFAKIVPTDQGFEANYAGIFHLNFWRFGEWVEVIIDDRFPVTVDGKLRFGQNRSTPNEFWGPLLEKAYAKLNGSYRAISVGYVRDALVDLTGGMTEAFNLRKEDRLPPELFDIMATSFKAGSLLGCGIWGNVGAMREELMWNGLFRGHAYSITHVLQARVQGWSVKLLRLRNPWGRKEWTGAWSDGSDEWKNVSTHDKKSIGLTVEDDGEYWISYDDFLTNFHALDIVHLSAGTFARIGSATEPLVWEEAAHHGRWVKGVSAGGCGLLSDNKDLYYTNPQFYMVLKEPDESDVAGECTSVISLMQKQYRKRKMNPSMRNLVVGFDVHLVKDGKPELLTADTVCTKTMLKKQFRTRAPLREVSCRLSLSPGVYCIIPNTLKPHQDSEFLLRVYTHRKVESGILEEKTNTPGATEDPAVRPVGSVPSELFWVYAGDDQGIDARDLRDILNQVSRKEFGHTTAFGMEACRSLLAMIDKERSGVLNFEEISDLWDELLFWKKIFNRYDRDKSGSIDTYELRKVFKDIGMTLGVSAISSLATRYGGKDMTMFFEDFALCLARTVSLRVAFKEHCAKDRPDEARLTLDEWLQTMLYL